MIWQETKNEIIVKTQHSLSHLKICGNQANAPMILSHSVVLSPKSCLAMVFEIVI